MDRSEFISPATYVPGKRSLVVYTGGSIASAADVAYRIVKDSHTIVRDHGHRVPIDMRILLQVTEVWTNQRAEKIYQMFRKQGDAEYTKFGTVFCIILIIMCFHRVFSLSFIVCFFVLYRCVARGKCAYY